jgi:hypothetical protein
MTAATTLALPECGIFVTTQPIAEVPAGRLVYFHNHGDPGPGIYLPASWRANRAVFQPEGLTLPDPALASTLKALAQEGFYAVREPFDCCAQRCRRFEADDFVQLGYDARAQPILFLPELVGTAIAIPELGTRIDDFRVARLRRLRLLESEDAASGDETRARDHDPFVH